MRVIHRQPARTAPVDPAHDAQAAPGAQERLSSGDAVSRLAGGVAHEFNNLLTVIAGHADLLLDHLAPSHPARASAMQICRAVRTGASVTSELLAIGRCQVLTPARFDVNDVVWRLAERIAPTLPEDVTLAVELASSLPCVEGDAGQIERAVSNLIANARDAMPSGGSISITTRTVDTPRARAVQIAVADSGCGLADDVRMKMFDPFFSTKPVGKGAGLGLPAARGIVEQSGGAIDVEPSPGRGTIVTISLPMAVPVGTEPVVLAPRLRPSSADAIRLPVAASS